MTRECGINCRGKDPELRNIDHDEHDQSCLPYCRLACFRLWLRQLSIRLFVFELLLPTAQTCPSRVSTSMVSNGRGGGP